LPDKRRHRGPNPEDAVSFAQEQWPALREAVADMSWLLSRGYADKSTLKLIGDRHCLTERQRMAVMRSACSDSALERRRAHAVNLGEMVGQSLLLDGYNVLTTIEAALAGGVVIEGRDGCYRDMASMHGSFRKVDETAPAVELVGRQLKTLRAGRCIWYLDRPVSNSGRLKTVIAALADREGWDWAIELVNSPDAVLIESTDIVATADSVILDRCAGWLNLARCVVDAEVPHARIVSLR
jgi:hypothetical protein